MKKLKGSILVIEDNIHVADELVATLTGNNYICSQASGVTCAKRILEGGVPDAILCDFNLDDGTAIDILKFLQGHKVNLPVVILSATSQENLQLVHGYGNVKHILRKPVDVKELFVCLEKIISTNYSGGIKPSPVLITAEEKQLLLTTVE